jgi:catechol 2,3-dioxygenase-like lactoylglutathione lyase family enzyme
MKVYRISAITLRVKDMEKSCTLYSKIPGFTLTYGGKPSDRFTTFEIGKGNNITYLNLELIEEEEEEDHEDDHSGSAADFNNNKFNLGEKTKGRENFGRIIFHTDNVDKLYSYMEYDEYVSKSIIFESKPTNAPWGERFFHIREPDGYQLSFAQPL